MNKRFSEALSSIIMLAVIVFALGALAKTFKVDELFSGFLPGTEDTGGDVGGSDSDGNNNTGDSSGGSGDNTGGDSSDVVEIESITLPEEIIF